MDDPLALWAYLAERIEDDDRNGNNRFEVAASASIAGSGGRPVLGPSGQRRSRACPFANPATTVSLCERRRIETLVPRAKTCFQLMGAGSVGSQALLGIARLQGLRERYGAAISVAPFERRKPRWFWRSATRVCSPT
jgi:molybdopterin molybdotransferase